MYRSLLLAILIALPLPGQLTTDIGQLRWLAGHWGLDPGSQKMASEEHWIAPAAGMMLAVSRTIFGGKVVHFEFLRIETRPDGIYYVAQPGGNPPIAFKLTKAGRDSVTFENPTHDNPKIITYQLDGPTGLVATVEGDERGQHKKQSFRFEKVTGR
jgi:hypothetical protein